MDDCRESVGQDLVLRRVDHLEVSLKHLSNVAKVLLTANDHTLLDFGDIDSLDIKLDVFTSLCKNNLSIFVVKDLDCSEGLLGWHEHQLHVFFDTTTLDLSEDNEVALVLERVEHRDSEAISLFSLDLGELVEHLEESRALVPSAKILADLLIDV